VLFQVFQLAEF